MQVPQQYVRAEVLALSAYHVPDSQGLVKLDAMENPYPLPELVASQLPAVLAGISVNRYPDPSAKNLKSQLRVTFNLPHEVGILLGNGSDELIQLIILALAKKDAVVMAVEPSFVMYRMVSLFCGVRYVGVPLCADFSLDVTALLDAIHVHQPAVLFLAYPNNPTGNLFPRAALEAVLSIAPGLVVIDEAYQAFAGDSWLSSLPYYPNLLVMRTLSKVGLAGLRLGYMMGSSQWLSELDKLRLPYNINSLTQAVAALALQHIDDFDEQAHAICAERVRMSQCLRDLGMVVFDSAANFLLFRVHRAVDVNRQLREQGVLIKCLDTTHPLLHDCLRVTVGTVDENTVFLDALRLSLKDIESCAQP